MTTEGEQLHVSWIGVPEDDELRGLFRTIEAHARRVPRYAILYDFRRAELPSAARRRLLATLTRETPPDVRSNCAGVAFVIASAAIRGALTVVLWFQPMTLDHAVFDSVEEAEHWLVERLRVGDADTSRS